jgi:hypothetical protein
MCRLTRYYEAWCGWTTVVVGSQLGSQLGYFGRPAHSSECTRPAEASRDHRRYRRPSRDCDSATAGRHPRWHWFRAQRPGAHRWMARIDRGALIAICQLCRTSRRRSWRPRCGRPPPGKVHADRDFSYVARLASFWLGRPAVCGQGRIWEGGRSPRALAFPFTPVEMREMWTYSDGASRSMGTGCRVAPPGPGAGSWLTRRPGTSGAWFRRENSPAGSGRWTCSRMCPGCPAIWGRLPRLTVPR